MIPYKFLVPLLFELEAKRGRTNIRMHSVKYKKVEDASLMEVKLLEIGKEFSDLRDREYTM